MSMGLTISTLHSHHHLEWNHPENFADTGNCITSDTSLCPICGYLLHTDVPAASQSNKIFYHVEEIVLEKLLFTSVCEVETVRGRAPPAA